MSNLAGPLYALRILGYVTLRPLVDFIDQAVIGRSPLNPKD